MVGNTPNGAAIDHEARRVAEATRIRLEAHEEHCSERWESTKDGLSKLEGQMSSLDAKISNRIAAVHNRIDALGRRAMYVILAICGFAILQWLLWSKVALPGAG